MKSEQAARVRAAVERQRRHEIAAAIVTRRAAFTTPGTLGALSAHLRSTDDRDTDATEPRFALPIPSHETLRSLFDLTSAECKLAQQLARGDSMEEIAQKLCIKMATARTQLAAVFGKTGTRRQAKLVAILSRVAHIESTAQTPEAAVVDLTNTQTGGRRHAIG